TQADRSGHYRYLHGRSWRSRRRRARKITNEAAASARKAAWVRPWSSASGEPDRAASSQTTPSQAKLTPLAARSGLTQVDAAEPAGPNPARRQKQGKRLSGGYEQPEEQHRRQRDRENRDRAQQDQPQHRIGRDEFRFERRVQPRVIAGCDHQAGHDRRHGQE